MYSFLNQIIASKDYKSYLEIGIDDPDNNFNHIRCERKVGVDPYNDDTGCHAWDRANKEAFITKIDPNASFYRMTSDHFFEVLKPKSKVRFDLIYIDGLHLEEQVDKDIANALRFVSPHGMIILDDVPPVTEYEEKTPPDPGQPWRGTVWRSFAKLRMEYYHGFNEHGLYTIKTIFKSVILPYRQQTRAYVNRDFPETILSFEFLKAYEDELLNNISYEQFFEIIK
jgi:hypothetical protein